MTDQELVIDEELSRILPALTDEEKEDLEANLVKDGRCTDPIIYWNDDDKNLIVDGMHRWPICRRLGIPYHTEPIVFADRNEAKLWILNRQLGRRNLLHPMAVRKVRGELYNALKAPDLGHGNLRRGKTPSGKSAKNAENSPECKNYTPEDAPASCTLQSPRNRAAEQVAQKANVSCKTAVTDGKFAVHLRALPDGLRNAIETGNVKATDAQVARIAGASDTAKQTIARDLRVGKTTDVEVAIVSAGLSPTRAKKKTPTAAELKAAAAELDEQTTDELEPTPEETVERHNRQIESFCRDVQKLAATCPDLHWFRDKDRRDAFLTKVKQGCDTLRSAKSVVCPKCAGNGCSPCQDQGFVPKMMADSMG